MSKFSVGDKALLLYCETEGEHAYGAIPVLKVGGFSIGAATIVEVMKTGCTVRIEKDTHGFTSFQSNAELMPMSALPLLEDLLGVSDKLREALKK